MRLVVFDLDGTLIDSHAFITSVMTETFVSEGLSPPTPEEGRGVIGLSLPVALEKLSGVSGAALDALVARYRNIFHARVGDEGQELLFTGALDALNQLAAEPETLLGIATGKAMRGVERMLDMHDLGEHFVTRQTPDTNPSKPHPGMLISAMNETGVAPEQVVMIGDTTFDMEMAKAADCFAIGVSWGSHPENLLLDSGADVVIHSYNDLLPAINSLLEA